MKQTCDCCGGTLRKKIFGRGAVCKSCGMTYTAESLEERNSFRSSADERTGWNPGEEIAPAMEFSPRQFVMDVTGQDRKSVSGRVRQGGIGLGDMVYVNGNCRHPYRVWYIWRGSEDVCCAKAGDHAHIGLRPNPGKAVLKNAAMLTGVPDPVDNGYNYPGTMQEYFLHLLTAEFPQYQIVTDVTQEELKIPVSFMLYENNRPVLAVFLIDSTDSGARYQVTKAARIFSPEGVGCTHFFENYRNDASYVIQRVRSALG